MSPAELQTVSNRSLCNFYADSRAVDIERSRRGLRCTNSADNPATWYLLEQYGRPQPPPRVETTNCRAMGNTVSCTTF